jgi:hypothetical protein
VTQSVDATYDFTLTQTTSNGLQTSGQTTFRWIRDTSMSATPTITTTGGTNGTSASGSAVTYIDLGGACITGSQLLLSGDVRQSDITVPSTTVTCSSSAYNFRINKSTDGTYNFFVVQKEASKSNSAPVSYRWVKDSRAPMGIDLITPFIHQGTGSYTSGESTLTMSGACELGSTVYATGSGSALGENLSASCVNGTFTMTTGTKASNLTTYTYTLYQTDAANNSTTTNLRTIVNWYRNTSVATPTITSPTTRNYSWNGSGSITISGACTSTVTMYENGLSVGSAACSGSQYTYTRTPSTDGIYTYRVSQSTANSNGKASLRVIRDTEAPVSPNITYPLINPHTSGDVGMELRGTCEPFSTVVLSGASSQTAICNEVGEFVIGLAQAYDGAHDYSVRSVDAAGNSSMPVAFEWIRNASSMLATPSVTSHVSSPAYTNGSSITVTGSCTTGNTVTIGGVAAAEVTGSSLAYTCASNAYTFTVNKSTDGVYPLTITQATTTASYQTSAPASLIWVRDTVAPGDSTLYAPTNNSYTSDFNLGGTCENGATVNLTGDFSADFVCQDAFFRVPVQKVADGGWITHTVRVTDRAGNQSSNASNSRSWWRLSSYPLSPTVLTQQGRSMLRPFQSFSTATTVYWHGDCQGGYWLYVYDPRWPGSSYVSCSNDGYYSYATTYPASGGTNFVYTYASGYSNYNYYSATRDNTVPTVSLSAASQSGQRVAFTFSSNDTNSVLRCKLDSGTYTICSSPLVFNNLTTGSHTFYVQATDFAGNVSVAQSVVFNQTTSSTLALYHMDDAAPLVDHSVYNLTLVDPNTTASGTGKFAQGRTFATTGNKYLYAAANSVQNYGLSNSMSVEAYIYPTSAVTAANTYIVNKSGASSDYGWYFAYRGSGSSMNLVFAASANGSTAPTQVLSPETCTFTANTWMHVAAVWNNGKIKFYCNGVFKGMSFFGNIGTAELYTRIGTSATASTIYSPVSATLNIGRNEAVTPAYFNGVIDEVRISQYPRDTGITYPLPSVPLFSQ